MAQIGDKFTLKCGTELTILGRVNANYVLVCDEKGNERSVQLTNLSRGKVRWGRPTSAKIGDRFESNNYGWCEVIAVSGKSYTIRFDNTGGTREHIAFHLLRDGDYRDYEAPKHMPSSDTYYIGSRWESNICGWATVTEFLSNEKITVEFDETKNRACVSGGKLRSGQFSDKIKRRRDKPCKSYVYVAYYEGEVVYVGKGYGTRYLHCNSGTSHCYELNKLHFEGKEVEVIILADGLYDADAKSLESEIIADLKPRHNKNLLG